MKPVWLYLFLVFFSAVTFANGPVYKFPGNEKKPIKILLLKKDKYIISADNIYVVNRRKIRKVINIPFHCNDATVYKNDIILATDSGIVKYSISGKGFDFALIEKYKRKIDCIISDGFQRLWFSSKFEGTYMVGKDLAFHSIMKSPVTYCIASTPDSSVWVATNVGLYKISEKDFTSVRFAEEGIEGYSIPDNIVENIFTDNTSNVWAKLSESLVYISNDNQLDDIPSFDYIVNKNNSLFSIASINHKAYLFVTSEGLIYLPDIHPLDHHTEIHDIQEEKGFSVSNEDIGKPKEWKACMVSNVIAVGNETWFITENGMWSIKTKILFSRLSKKV